MTTIEKKASDTERKQTRWTIMVYIAADGGLANFAVESLKQLHNSVRIKSAPAGQPKVLEMPGTPADKASVVVAAQFAINAPGGQQIPRYIFNQNSNGNLGNCLKQPLNAPANMTEQQALISFIDWVCKNEECAADKYALILWGHGPELLLQRPADQSVYASNNNMHASEIDLYLTPEDLRVALEEGLPPGKKLDIIAFDACSMSMLEVAYEIRKSVNYMVASQEEVPDPSFPYDSLVELIRKRGQEEKELLKEGVYAYVGTYQDYICTPNTGMKSVTLTALRLNACDSLVTTLNELSRGLLDGANDPSLPDLLIAARKDAKDFVGGLYVDLRDFCKQLYRRVSISEPDGNLLELCNQKTNSSEIAWKCQVLKACKEVIHVLGEDSVDIPADANSLVLANGSSDPLCHGVSLYFPYLRDEFYAEVAQPLVKGGRDTIGKGFSLVMNRAASGLLMCARRDLIVVTEGYYGGLELAAKTRWYDFIVELWSKILIESAPQELDFRYSAQQAAVNVCKAITCLKKPPMSGSTTYHVPGQPPPSTIQIMPEKTGS